jgi:hypothetical protein
MLAFVGKEYSFCKAGRYWYVAVSFRQGRDVKRKYLWQGGIWMPSLKRNVLENRMLLKNWPGLFKSLRAAEKCFAFSFCR